MKTIDVKILVNLFMMSVISGSCFAQADVKSLAATCIACHGENGISQNTDWPNLAGQQVDYLVKEMKAYRDGERVDTVMLASLLKGLSDQQLVDIAEYYSKLPANKVTADEVNLNGAYVRALCVSCHGLSGNTVTSVWPNLAGQQAGYLKKTLLDYKSGSREHVIMNVIANELTDQQIADVAEYYYQHP